MANRNMALQLVKYAVVEYLRNKAETLMIIYTVSGSYGNPRAFLTPVLKGIKAVIYRSAQSRIFAQAVYSEYSAGFLRFIIFKGIFPAEL